MMAAADSSSSLCVCGGKCLFSESWSEIRGDLINMATAARSETA